MSYETIAPDIFRNKDGVMLFGRSGQSAGDIEAEADRPVPPTTNEVRLEAQRRMILLTRARDAAHLDIIISNSSREAIRLLHKGASNWTKREAVRAKKLATLDTNIEKIRAASNRLEAMNSVPVDYADEKRWPSA